MLPQSRKTIVRSSRSSGGWLCEALEVEEAVLVGQRELVGGHEHDRVLAQRGEHAVHRHERAERVAVGVLVRDEHEPVARRGARRGPARGCCRAVHACSRPPAPRRCSRSRRNARSGRVVVDEARARACASAAARWRRGPAGSRGRSAAPRASPRAAVGVAEDAHVDASVAQIWACLDVGHGHESDARVLEVLGQGVAEDLPHGLVDATHPLAAHPSPPASSNESAALDVHAPPGSGSRR